MRIMHLIAAAILATGAAAATKLIDGQSPGQALAATAEDGPLTGSVAYRLAVNGKASKCLMWPGRQVDTTSRSLDLSDGCTDLAVTLAKVRLWIESPHGDVALADADGNALVEFGASDGAAFESYRPLAPLMTLTALR
jgi:hypothetical protein